MAGHVCWNCNTFAHHEPLRDPVRRQDDAWMSVTQCAHCRALSLAVVPGEHQYNKAVELIARGGDVTWLPSSADFRAYPDVPEHIAAAASEAHACLSVGAHRAAVLMTRSVIEAIAKEHGFVKGYLRAKIDEMLEKDLISRLVHDQAHEIRYFGNDMAHGDFVEPISAEASNEIIGIMGKVLASVYQDPAQLQALRAARLAREKVNKSPPVYPTT